MLRDAQLVVDLQFGTRRVDQVDPEGAASMSRDVVLRRRMDVTAFAEAQLPPPPARVLEVGCGKGDLARAVARLGYEIVAIDPQAPDGEIFEPVSLEEFAGSGPFDAVLANRALHHIPDLASALDRVTLLLRPGGRLIVHEHAWELMDERTARWYLERRAAIDPSAPASVETCLADWNTGHAGLHGYAGLRGALDQRFRERYFAWTPYLHGELGGPEVEREERDLIEAGMIQPIGFNYAGEM
jgi:SAM-dependent methyltransferase